MVNGGSARDDGRKADVLIAGGGPVGLFLACELGRFGVSALVVERRGAPRTDGVSSVRGVSRRTLQTLRLRGMDDLVTEASRKTLAEIAGRRPTTYAAPGSGPVGGRTENFGDWRLQAAMKGHFGVIPLFDRDGEFPDMAIIPVAYAWLEQIFADEAAARGSRILRGRAVEDVSQDPAGGVAVTLDDGSTVYADYAVGADGGRSTVRQRAGFAFPGTDPTMIARGGELVTLADPEKLPHGITRMDRGVLMIGLIPGQIHVLEYGDASADWAEPTTPGSLQASLRRVSGTDVTVTAVESPIRYTDNARQAAAYRRGRVLLAGDAAHVHSPFGAQGLNLGLQDAANLGWKLALVTRGLAPGTLLDSYGEERHPVAARVLRNSRAQAALIHPDAQVDALRGVFAEVIEFPDVRRHFIKMINGVDIRYDVACDHPLAGAFLPDLELTGVGGSAGKDAPAGSGGPNESGGAGAGHAGAFLGDGRALLLDLADSAELRERAGGWSDRVRTVTARCPGSPELAAVLVRPDGYVLWAAGRDAPAVVPEAVLRRWFGGEHR